MKKAISLNILLKPQHHNVLFKRTYILFFVCCFFSFLLHSCKTSKGLEASKKETVTIKLIQVNDVYEISPLGGGAYGGMARVAHISDSIKRQFPNSYLVMAGDFLNPSLLGTLKVAGKGVKGQQMIEVMNAMDFDLATFGNHEFDIKENELQERLNESTFKWVSANVFQKNGNELRVFHTIKEGDSIPIPETHYYDIDIGKDTPVRIGFFGVTINSNPKDFVHYSDYLLESRSAVNTLAQAQSDIIVGLTHLKLAQDVKVAEASLSIDFIMGGHEHNNMLVTTNGASIAKADANARSMYVHTLTYDAPTDALAIFSELVSITNKVPSLPRVQEVVAKWDAILEQEIKTVVENPNEVIYNAIAFLDGTDTPTRSAQTNLGMIIAQAMAESFETPVDGALVNGGSFRLDDILEGDVVSLDIFRVLPFGGGVLKVDLTGALLNEILDFGIAKAGTGAYLQRYGFGQKVGVWYMKNEPIDASKTYTIAFSDYLLKGYDIPFLTPENSGIKNIYKPTESEPAYDIRRAVITYMKTL
ncbi:MAG: 5'-nucleotidase/UDP-sugar diphosphatase [Patiriisocius sp.]|jgi:5'-nucleotidase/UDP-sugar diphosphatase